VKLISCQRKIPLKYKEAVVTNCSQNRYFFFWSVQPSRMESSASVLYDHMVNSNENLMNLTKLIKLMKQMTAVPNIHIRHRWGSETEARGD